MERIRNNKVLHSGTSILLAAPLALLAAGCVAGDDPGLRADALGSPAAPVGAAVQADSSCVALPRSAAVTIQQQSPTLNYGSAPTLTAGTSATATHSQTLLSFDLSSISTNNTVIASASVGLEEIADTLPAWYGNGPGTVSAYQVTAPWSQGTATWNSFAGAYNPAAISSFVSTTAVESASFDVSALVTQWFTGAAPNDGLLLDEPGKDITYMPTSSPLLTVCTGCTPGHADCDGSPANGCEVDTANDPNNCGSCGMVCGPGTQCEGGACAPNTCQNPGGSYGETCFGCSQTGDFLTCTCCLTEDQQCSGTTFNVCDCAQNISNCNGQLQCNAC